jgi:hypothetical protein
MLVKQGCLNNLQPSSHPSVLKIWAFDMHHDLCSSAYHWPFLLSASQNMCWTISQCFLLIVLFAFDDFVSVDQFMPFWPRHCICMPISSSSAVPSHLLCSSTCSISDPWWKWQATRKRVRGCVGTVYAKGNISKKRIKTSKTLFFLAYINKYTCLLWGKGSSNTPWISSYFSAI